MRSNLHRLATSSGSRNVIPLTAVSAHVLVLMILDASSESSVKEGPVSNARRRGWRTVVDADC